MNECDIIIPIYNAYECVKSCIESVLKNTDLSKNRLILIDDNSTDKRINQLLAKYKNKEGIKVLKNNENSGYVFAVNRGMKLSKNDVVLLNSDTEVTKEWLEKIKKCAYSSHMIATVTPLSNNATLASVPRIFEANEIPNNISLEQMSKLVEECSYRDYPEIPTGHGFCLYIKRDVIERIGYFDEIAFGKGYGEENDFCFRALNLGYRHILCDDTYILHKEAKSFKEEKEKLKEAAKLILYERYPKYMKILND